MYSPVNAHKLKREAREWYDLALKILQTKATKVEVPAKFYDEFLEAMSIMERKSSKESFHIGRKVVVRK
jgi:hypothetical protein